MWLFIFLISLIVALLDTTVAPSMSIYGGVVSFTTSVILIFLVKKSFRNASALLIFSTIFLVIFSQVPVAYILLPNFFLLITVILVTNKRLIDRPSTILSVPIFIFTFLFFGLLKLLIMREFSLVNLFLMSKGAIYSAIFTAILYFITNKISYFLNPQAGREQIKINI
jgi:hypothetical protein